MTTKPHSPLLIRALSWQGSVTMTLILGLVAALLLPTQHVSAASYFRNANNPAVFGYRFDPNSAKQLQSVTVQPSSISGTFVFFGATGGTSATNTPPTVSAVSKTGNEDATITFSASDFTAKFSDADGDSLSKISIGNLPPNGTLRLSGAAVALNQEIAAANLGDLSFTPNANWNGTSSFGWNGSDGATYATNGAAVSLTVNPVNDAPHFTSQPVTRASQNVPYRYVVKIADVDAERYLSLIVTTEPAWLSLVDNDYGPLALEGTPSNADVGTHEVVLVVSDSKLSTEQRFTITVDNVNDAPSISPIASQTTTVGQATSPIAFTVGDIDNAAQSLTVVGSSSNAALVPSANIVVNGSDAERTVTITPAASQTGTTTITLTVSDGSLSNSTSFALTVGEAKLYMPLLWGPPAEPDLVTSISMNPDQRSLKAGELVQFAVTVTNQGAAAAEPFWVDLYLNPAQAPTRANVLWYRVCGITPCHGVGWGVVDGLAPGESITLASIADSYNADHTRWPGWLAAGTTDVYVYVDSWSPDFAAGNVQESNENNNRAELRGLTVAGTNPAIKTLDWDTISARPRLESQ